MRLPKTIGTASPSVRTEATDIEKGLICSFPTRSDGTKLEIVQGVPLNDFAKAKVEASVNELKEERAMVEELLGVSTWKLEVPDL